MNFLEIIANPGFNLVTSKIFEFLDFESLTSSTRVSLDMKYFVDNQKILWINQVKILKKSKFVMKNSAWDSICDLFLDSKLKTSEIQRFVRIFQNFLKNQESELDLLEFYKNQDDFSSVQFLLKYFGKIYPEDIFSLAITYGNLDIVKTVNLQNVSNCELTDAFMISCMEGNLSLVSFLLKLPDVDFNARDEYGATALIHACENGHFDVVELLLNSPKMTIELEDIGVAMRLACDLEHFSVLKLLSDFKYETQSFLSENPFVEIILRNKG